eukprot:4864420-Amphidinium_carterae.1
MNLPSGFVFILSTTAATMGSISALSSFKVAAAQNPQMRWDNSCSWNLRRPSLVRQSASMQLNKSGKDTWSTGKEPRNVAMAHRRFAHSLGPTEFALAISWVLRASFLNTLLGRILNFALISDLKRAKRACARLR